MSSISMEKQIEHLSSLNSQAKGKEFESLVKEFLEKDPVYRQILKEIYLWHDWPDRWGPDNGIDLVAITHNGEMWAIQAKAFDSARSIRKRDIDSFLAESSRPCISFRLIVTTTSNVCETVRRSLCAQEKPIGLVDGDRLARTYLTDAGDSCCFGIDLDSKRKQSLRSHQKEAVSSTISQLANSSRAQVIMPCGTGKTLVAIHSWLRLSPSRTVVAVPSLTLLRQTLIRWSHEIDLKVSFHAVCSDHAIAASDSSTVDLGIQVTTAENQIVNLLQTANDPQIIFCTYQSTPVLARATQRAGIQLDLLIADEAHRTAGLDDACFSTVLSDDQIFFGKRIFLTATPKLYSRATRKALEQHDLTLCSMDDEKIFGKVAYKLSFTEAISQGLLTDYKVIVLGCSSEEVQQLVSQRSFIEVEQLFRNIDASSLAGLVATHKLMMQYNTSRVISFHSRIEKADKFARALKVISQHFNSTTKAPLINAKHVSGRMPVSQRKAILRQLEEYDGADKMLVANAKCLGEGIDVPSLDAIAFIDPRSSQTDIVQAVGRALRLSADKKEAFILLPVLLEADQETDVQLASSAFGPVWRVLRALRAHDESLGEAIDELRFKLGRQGSLGKSRLPKVTLDVPLTSVELEAFDSKFQLLAVQESSSSTSEWIGSYTRFYDREGHGNVPLRHDENGKRLGAWVRNQRARYQNGLITTAQTQLLEALPGWSWSPLEDNWEKGYRQLVSYQKQHRTCAMTDTCIFNDYPLGRWCSDQRERKKTGRLAQKRIDRLNQIPGWQWEPREAAWFQALRLLQKYQAREGNCNVPGKHKEENFGLGDWVAAQRAAYKNGKLSKMRIEELEEVPGWLWSLKEFIWITNYQFLIEYAQEHGSFVVPGKAIYKGVKLGNWVADQRKAYKTGKLSQKRISLLESLEGWTWGSGGVGMAKGFIKGH